MARGEIADFWGVGKPIVDLSVTKSHLGNMSRQILSEDEYFCQHGKEIGFPDPIGEAEKSFNFNMVAAKTAFERSELFGRLIAKLETLPSKYIPEHPELLFLSQPTDLSIQTKSFSSTKNKVYRANYIGNRNFPEKPKGYEFIGLSDLYDHERMNDLLRARLVCKYMDGPSFVADALALFCKDEGLDFRSYPMNNDAGYYAWHCYIRIPVEIKPGVDVEEKQIWFELQVTTQLAEVITSLTHGLYEGARSTERGQRDDSWRWDPRSQKFRSAYLGHTLHLLEGVIQTFRDEVFDLPREDKPGLVDEEQEAGASAFDAMQAASEMTSSTVHNEAEGDE